MKPSHFTTPRQLSDACFVPSADPIDRPVARSGYDAPFMLAVGAAVMVALAAISFAGWL